jgi:hypothetical protein
MNQPGSQCLSYHNEVQRMNEALVTAAQYLPSDMPVAAPADELAYPDTDSMAAGTPPAMVVDNPNPHSPTLPFVETYPGAAHVFGRAATFMDIFDADEHAEKRHLYPYYPFSSEGEWQLTCFLLCSDLSIASIDKFLRLKLVRGLQHLFSLSLEAKRLL